MLAGAIPYTVVNFYNKGLNLWALVREWLLGAHYASWTGRHGRPTRITSADPWRAAAVAGVAGCIAAALHQL